MHRDVLANQHTDADARHVKPVEKLPNLWIELVGPQRLPQFLNSPRHDGNHIIVPLLDILDRLREPLLILKGLRARQLDQVAERLNIHLLDYRDLPRGILCGDRHGWLKLVAARDDGRVLGAHLVGEDACELVHYGRALVESGARLTDVVRGGFSAMTFHGLYQSAAEDALAQRPLTTAPRAPADSAWR